MVKKSIHILKAVSCRYAMKGDWYKTVLSREECVLFVASQNFHVISPVGQILVIVHRFDREVVMTFQQFEFNFVFNEGLCLNKWTSPRMSCLEWNANYPSWHNVRQVSVC